jgi:hypothetical protein
VTAEEAVEGSWTSDTPVSYDQSGYCVAFREQTTHSDGEITKSSGTVGDPTETVFVNQPWVKTRTVPADVIKPGEKVTDAVKWGNLAEGDIVMITAWIFPVLDKSKPVAEWVCDIPAKEKDWPKPIPAGRHVVTKAEAVEGAWLSDTPVSYDQSGYCVAFREQTTTSDGKVIKSAGRIGDPDETAFVDEGAQAPFLAFTGSTIGVIWWTAVAVALLGAAGLVVRRRMLNT